MTTPLGLPPYGPLYRPSAMQGRTDDAPDGPILPHDFIEKTPLEIHDL